MKPGKLLKSIINFYAYQRKIWLDRLSRIVVICWSRQIGKSFTMAAWAVDRLLTRPGRLVTVLSNSRDNGAEFMRKVEEVCNLLGQAYVAEDLSPNIEFETMHYECKITVKGLVGRIKVLAANPRTARGFSGDLILDEFAFHQDSKAIWEAAEPILSSNPDFLCRICSTLNGRNNMFYTMLNCGQYPISIVTRTQAWQQGRKVYHPVTGQEIEPAVARTFALDKRAYDQNYECIVGDENTTLLTQAHINSASSNDCGIICEQNWSLEALALIFSCKGDLFVGVDVGRKRDLTAISVGEKLNRNVDVRGILRIQNMRLPQQQERLAPICNLPNFRHACLDMTGIGLGLTEYAQEEWGEIRIEGINFSSTVPTTDILLAEGRKAPTAKITEVMAVELLNAYEGRLIKHPLDIEMNDDLLKPERIVTNTGRVCIAATRDEAGHADHFWSLALLWRAANCGSGPFAYERIERPEHYQFRSRRGIIV